MRRSADLLPVLLAALLGLGAGVAVAQDAEKAARLLDDGLRRYAKHDLTGAIIQLRNALQADSRQLAAHAPLGKALLANDEPAAAEAQLSEALSAGADRAEVVVTLARAMNAQGRQPQMLEDRRLQPTGLPAAVQQQLMLERAAAQSDIGDGKGALLTLQQARALPGSGLGSWLTEVPLRLRLRQFTEARAAADHALGIAPDSAEVLYQKASIHHASGEGAQALVAYEQALKTQPRHAEAQLARAGLLVDLQRDADALAALNEFQAIRPRDPRAAFLRALLAARANDAPAARTALRGITELLDPVPIDYLRYRPQFLALNALAHVGLGEPHKAKPLLELATRLQPGSPLVKLLAQLAVGEANVGRAVELLEAHLKSSPDDDQTLLMLASAHMSQGRLARAVALMQAAIKAKDTPEFRTTLGLALLQSGKVASAATEFATAYRADPGQTRAGLALADLHLREGRPTQALAVAETLLRAHPDDAAVLMLQADVRSQAGDAAGARAGYEKALLLDPALLDAQLGLAQVDIASGHFDAADQRLRDLLRNDASNSRVLFELAVLHERQGKADEALKWLEGAVNASKTRETRANFALVAWHLRHGQPARALDAAKTLLAKGPEDVDALRAYAAAQAANRNLAGAKSTLTNAARRAAFDAPRLLEVARQQIDVQDYGGAAYSLDKALSGDADFLPAVAMLSSVELAQGDITKAEQRARQLIQVPSRAAIGYQLLADVATRRGQDAAAVDALRKAHDLDRSQASLVQLMRVLGNQGAPQPAIELGEAWLRSRPDDLAVRNALAELQLRAHNIEAARRHYEAILKRRPDHAETLRLLARLTTPAGAASAAWVERTPQLPGQARRPAADASLAGFRVANTFDARAWQLNPGATRNAQDDALDRPSAQSALLTSFRASPLLNRIGSGFVDGTAAADPLAGWELIGTPGGRVSSWWLLTAYDSSLTRSITAGSGDAPDVAEDAFRLFAAVGKQCAGGTDADGACAAVGTRVPEPATLALVGLALLVVAGLRRPTRAA